MHAARDIATTRAVVADARRAGRRIGLVPTMGALHAGHMSLIEAARDADTFIVVSIFVNPTQFGPNEDFDAYPRDLAGDLESCRQAGVALAFTPTVADMYRPDATTTVHVSELTETLCGLSRPGHFDGVATVVTKLFNIVQPDVAFFGQKDAQQLAVIRRLVRDLDQPVEIVACPTMREPDGLAMSSRNAMLSEDERRRATALYRALCAGRDMISAGERSTTAVESHMRSIVEQADPQQIDYVSVVDPENMQPVNEVGSPVLLALAVRIGPTRLIDNVLVDPTSKET